MQLTFSNVAVFLTIFTLYIGVLKIYFPENATVIDLLKTNELKSGQKISLTQVINRDIDGVNNSYLSNYKSYDSVLIASDRMQEDFFNIIQVLLLPILILGTIFLYAPAHPFLLGALGFIEVLIAVNRYSTFDSFTKDIEEIGYSDAVDILKTNSYLSSNLSINTNFLVFPLLQLFLLYFAMFIKF